MLFDKLSFFENIRNEKRRELNEKVLKVEEFLRKSGEENKRIVLVTSGGTAVPLETNTVRYLDNFSTGSRGALSTEFFLRNNFLVIFLHRTDSLKPFHQHFAGPNLLDHLQVDQNTISFKPTEFYMKLFEEYGRLKDKCLLIDYFSVMDYLYLLIEICLILNQHKESVLVYLAAAVSDFYLPIEETSVHKIQSNQMDYLNLVLKPVPKIINFLKTTACPNAFIVSFKLETDESLLVKKAQESLKKYKHDLVISNSLLMRKEQVIFVGKALNVENVYKGKSGVIEEEIIKKVIETFTENFESKSK